MNTKLVKKLSDRFDRLILGSIQKELFPKSKEELQAIFKEHDKAADGSKGIPGILACAIAACAAYELHAQYGVALPPGMRDESAEISKSE